MVFERKWPKGAQVSWKFETESLATLAVIVYFVFQLKKDGILFFERTSVFFVSRAFMKYKNDINILNLCVYVIINMI